MLLLQRIRRAAEVSARDDHESFCDAINGVDATPASAILDRSQLEVSAKSLLAVVTSPRFLVAVAAAEWRGPMMMTSSDFSRPTARQSRLVAALLWPIVAGRGRRRTVLGAPSPGINEETIYEANSLCPGGSRVEPSVADAWDEESAEGRARHEHDYG
jgi:hypothetical protein